jgi:NitT/TauT family transport system permease protein
MGRPASARPGVSSERASAPQTGGRAEDRFRRALPPTGVFVLVLAGWEAAVRVLGIQVFLLPAPSAIALTLASNAGFLLEAAWYTAQEAIAGFGIGCGLGILVALLSVRWRSVADALLPYSIAANSVPIIAFAPLAIVWFGVEQGSKVAIVATMTFFPAMISTTRGLLSPDPAALELMRSYGATSRHVFLKLRLPAALPFIFTALKVSASLSMIGAVVGEFFGGFARSLGVYIISQTALFHTREAWAAIIVACAFGITFYLAIAAAERLVMPWHVSVRR